MNTTIRGAVALTLCAFALGGCASTSGMDLKTPVDGFATAATAAQTTLQTYDQILDATIYDANTTRALGGKGFVSRVDPGDCINPGKASALGHCRLSLEINGQKFPLTSQPADPIAREIMAGIVTYAANLQTIAALDTEGPVKSATTSALANITTLSQDIDTATARPGSGVAPSSITAALTAYSGPVSDAAGFALGAYLDSVKLKALREATAQMDKVLGPMLDVCRQSVEAGLKIQRDKYFAAYTASYDAYDHDRASLAKLEALKSNAAAYDAALSVSPVSVFDDLKTAHAALKDALSTDKPNFASAWLALQQAISTAQRVQTIINEFRTAAQPAPAG